MSLPQNGLKVALISRTWNSVIRLSGLTWRSRVNLPLAALFEREYALLDADDGVRRDSFKPRVWTEKKERAPSLEEFDHQRGFFPPELKGGALPAKDLELEGRRMLRWRPVSESYGERMIGQTSSTGIRGFKGRNLDLHTLRRVIKHHRLYCKAIKSTSHST